jgi:hypothetical protein
MEIVQKHKALHSPGAKNEAGPFFSFGDRLPVAHPFFQPKLTINQPNDVYEKEADAVAEQVMKAPTTEKGVQAKPQSIIDRKPLVIPSPGVDRNVSPSPSLLKKEESLQPEDVEEEQESSRNEPSTREDKLMNNNLGGGLNYNRDIVQRKCTNCEEKDEKISRKETGNAEVQNSLVSVEQTLNSPGQPLPVATLSFMEERVGHDFGNVQIHNDAQAHQSSADINALAYTHKNHIVFNAGEYQPQSDTGKKLLAHELTHVVQQGNTVHDSIQKDDKVPADKEAPSTPPPSVTAPCSQTSAAGTYKATDKDSRGDPLAVSLGASEFGNTSKLGAYFDFGACKDKVSWHFFIKKLTVPIASKVQPIDFRIDVPSATDQAVTKDSYPAIVKDLVPKKKVKFSVSCGGNNFEDEVASYSIRKTYWNRQIVVDHEAFHRTDWDDKYRAELVEAEKQVWAHTIPLADAATAADAIAKANTDLTDMMAQAYQRTCKTFTPKKESRAYDKGAPQYQKLVDEVNARAVKEKW